MIKLITTPGSTEITSIEESPTSALVEKWEAFPLAECEQEDDILSDYANYLARQFRLPMESATLIACSAVIASAGSTRSLIGPGSVETPLSINLLLVGESTTMPHLAATEAFSSLTTLIRHYVWNRQHFTKETFAEDNHRITELLQKARGLDTKAQDNRAEWRKRSGDDYEETWRKVFSGNPSDYMKYEKESAELRNEAFAMHAKLRLEQYPGVLVENALPEELLSNHKISADGTVFNLDLNGSTWSNLVSERPKKAREIAQRIASGWQKSAYISRSEFFPAAALSSLVLMDTARFTRVWQNSAITESGLRRMLLVTNLSAPGTPADRDREIPDNTKGRFYDLKLKLLHYRDWKKNEIVPLSLDAQKVFFTFVKDVQQAEEDPNLRPREFLQSAAQHALRLALALHLGAGRTEEDEVSAETMRKACHLVVWSATSAKSIFDQVESATLQSCGDAVDEEVCAMVIRVRRKGKLTKRDLYRSYHDQRSVKLSPVLDKALNMGLLIEQDDGMLTLPASMVDREVFLSGT